MARLGRPGLSPECRQALWEMWRSGFSISEISRELTLKAGSVFTVLAAHGGIYQPPQLRRVGSLTLSEREDISRGVAAGLSRRAIARNIGRSPSTVSREISRNKGVEKYRALDADDRALRRAKRPKKCKLANNRLLRDHVEAKLREDWSPQQIAATLPGLFPDEERMRVSHETIYRSLFIQSRGVLGKDLQHHLRSRRPIRRNIRHTVKGQWRSQIKDAVPISQRPTEANDRSVAGHWEGDLIIGSGQTQIATLVERKTRFTLLVQLDGKDMETVTAGLTKVLKRSPANLLKSLTWDRGMELAGHKKVTANTGIAVFFADPRSPWQRGTNENTNRLLEWSPKVGHPDVTPVCGPGSG